MNCFITALLLPRRARLELRQSIGLKLPGLGDSSPCAWRLVEKVEEGPPSCNAAKADKSAALLWPVPVRLATSVQRTSKALPWAARRSCGACGACGACGGEDARSEERRRAAAAAVTASSLTSATGRLTWSAMACRSWSAFSGSLSEALKVWKRPRKQKRTRVVSVSCFTYRTRKCRK